MIDNNENKWINKTIINDQIKVVNNNKKIKINK